MKNKKEKLREHSAFPHSLPVLPLRDVVMYPFSMLSLPIGRQKSINAIKLAMQQDKFIVVCAQKSAFIQDPDEDDIFRWGVLAKIIELNESTDGTSYKVVLEAVAQAQIISFTATDDTIQADIKTKFLQQNESAAEEEQEIQRLVRITEQHVRDMLDFSPHVRFDTLTSLENIKDPLRKLYFASANLGLSFFQRQAILESFDILEQYNMLNGMLSVEVQTARLEEDLDTKVHETIAKAQRKFFIQEQIRVLQDELGDDEEGVPELAKLRSAIDQSGMPAPVHAKAMEEFDKLKKTPSIAPDAAILRNYLEWLTSLPWNITTKDNLNISHVETILNEDHYGLEDIKERVTEYIAVLNLMGGVQGQTLCLSGPPGVGKTSLARSIARALGRKFIRISLGGVRDEAEIRGHRRTYIGALPGKIIQSMKRAGTINPVILLDEIDKMSSDFRGDPSSALLEVLDPEQNTAFNDHYLEVDYDLSKVLFITTANVKYNIPLPLLDRMEVIELSSYLEHEKLAIAQNYLLPKQIEKNGLTGIKVEIETSAMQKIIREYTKEAGVRNLERQIGSVLRKLAKKRVHDIAAAEAIGKKASKRKIVIKENDIIGYLKAPRFKNRENDRKDTIGLVTGLAWTSVGGDTLPVEVTIMPGKDKLTLTGKLGDVMKESAMAALSYVRSHAQELNVEEDFVNNKDIHIHVPEGAIPKDGPSAGITMTMSLISAARQIPARGDIAMTGEVTLRGKVLAIGGLNEKLVAAKTAGITTVLVPKENQPDIENMNPDITKGMNIIFIETIQQALPYVFRSL